MSEVSIFEFESNQIRTVVMDEEIYFVGKDVAAILGYANEQQAIRTHCKGVLEVSTPSNGGQQVMKVIPERDVYRLIMRSKKPEAERFEEWVVSEVLPSIRKNGGYLKNQETMTPEQILANAMIVAQNVINEQQRQLTELTPKAEYHDKWMVSKGSFTTTEVAKQLGISAVKLNKFLREQGIKFKNSDLPIAGFESWFKMVDRVYENASTGDSGVAKQCRIKPEGAKKIVELWEKKNAA